MPWWGKGTAAPGAEDPPAPSPAGGHHPPAGRAADRAVVLPPNQELFRLDEACRLAGVQPATLRHWARELPAVAPAPASNGQLFLTRRQVRLLAEVQHLAAAGCIAPSEALHRAHDAAAAVQATGAAPEPAPGSGNGPRRVPWEDTEIRHLLDERLGRLPAGLEPARAGEAAPDQDPGRAADTAVAPSRG